MKEHVILAPGVDKPEALVREPLDRAFGHFVELLKKVSCSVARKHCGQAAPLPMRHFIVWIFHNQHLNDQDGEVRAALGEDPLTTAGRG